MEDVQDFAADAQVQTQTVDVGPFTLLLVGTGALRNRIDVRRPVILRLQR